MHQLRLRSVKCLKHFVNTHRKTSKSNTAASGIIEVRGERKQLLDDTTLDTDDMEDIRRAKTDGSTELDLRLKRAGEDIQNTAMTRDAGRNSDEEVEGVYRVTEEDNAGTGAEVDDTLTS